MASVAEQRLTLALEAAGLGTWTWDMATATTEWDVRLEELHGLSPGGFGGTFDDWVASLHPDDRAECVRRVQRALESPGPYVLLHRTTWLDGSIHWIECRGRVTVDDHGMPTGTIGVALDVTERERRDAMVEVELEEKHDLVTSLQQALLPSEIPSVPGVRVAARYVAAGSTVVGGDWYAVVPLPDGRLGLGIGDVAGHGLSAVAEMAGVRFSLRALAMGATDAEDVLTRLNDAVRLFEHDAFITALYGIVDPRNRVWSFSSAGHCPTVVRCANGTTSLIATAAQPPLGLDGAYHRQDCQLEPGSMLVLYTDGLIERRCESITDGTNRLIDVVRSGPTDPEALADHLLAELVGAGAHDDDVALLVVAIA